MNVLCIAISLIYVASTTLLYYCCVADVLQQMVARIESRVLFGDTQDCTCKEYVQYFDRRNKMHESLNMEIQGMHT